MPRLTKAEKLRIRAEETAKREARQAELRQAIDSGCPCCGSKVKRNLALAGWWQCSQLGAVGFRADASKPSCSWQTFVS